MRVCTCVIGVAVGVVEALVVVGVVGAAVSEVGEDADGVEALEVGAEDGEVNAHAHTLTYSLTH